MMYIKITESPDGSYNLEVYPEGWDNPETISTYTSVGHVLEEIESLVSVCLYNKEQVDLDFHIGGPYMVFDNEE